MSENNGKTQSDFYLRPDVERMIDEFDSGVKIGESCRITDLEKVFTYFPGFIGGIVGQPNQGKTTFMMFVLLVKAVVDGKKFAIFSDEMIISSKRKGKIERSASHIYNLLIHSYTGLNPYKHKGNQMSMERYQEALDFVTDHFFVVDTGFDKDYKKVLNAIKRACEVFGIYGWMIDPFKNLSIDEGKMTKDRVLQNVLGEFKYLAMDTETVGYFVLHPKQMKERELRKNGSLKGPYRVINQWDLLGGSVWNNSLDSIHSWYRPEFHNDAKSPIGSFYCLRQKMWELTNGQEGCETIMFDHRRNRFYFSGRCPIDGEAYAATQSGIDFKPTWAKEEKKKETVTANDLPF